MYFFLSELNRSSAFAFQAANLPEIYAGLLRSFGQFSPCVLYEPTLGSVPSTIVSR